MLKIHEERLQTYIDEADAKLDLEKLKEIKSILNKSFGEDNNQITKPTVESVYKEISAYYGVSNWPENEDIIKRIRQSPRKEIKLQITVYIPEFTITNSYGKKHVIRDMYVRFSLHYDFKLEYGLYGARSTLTQYEYAANYQHSHLPRTINQAFNSFCLGAGEIGQVMTLLRNEYSEVNFTLFCLHIKNYLQWESIEGVPYNRMSNILPRGTRPRHIGGSILEEARIDICTALKMLNVESLLDLLELTVDETGCHVIVTDKFESYIATMLESTIGPSGVFNKYTAACFCYKDDAGNYHATNPTAGIPRAPIDMFIFKGNQIKFKVIKSSETIKRQKYAHPGITNYICAALSERLTEILFSTQRARSENPIVCIQQTSEPDILPVQ